MRPLEDFNGDSQASVAEFFAAWNQDLPPSLADINQRICDRFINVHGRTRFSAWFKLTSTLADSVISGAFRDTDGSHTSDSGEGWRSAIEDLSGFRFAKPVAPPSAQLGAYPNMKKQNVSARLAASGGLMEETLPESCYDVIDTCNPLEETITEPEVQAFTDAVVVHIASKHGDWAVGRMLSRLYGKQAKQRLPNLPHRGVTRGHHRILGKMIEYKCKNRLHVRSACCKQSNPSTVSFEAVTCMFAFSQKPYRSKLTVKAIDLTDDTRELFLSRLSHLVNIDGDAVVQELKYPPEDHTYEHEDTPMDDMDDFQNETLAPGSPPNSNANSGPKISENPGSAAPQGMVLFGTSEPLPQTNDSSDKPMVEPNLPQVGPANVKLNPLPPTHRPALWYMAGQANEGPKTQGRPGGGP
jgi:hypothetical protein